MPKRRNKKSRCLSSSTFPSRPEYFSASSFCFCAASGAETHGDGAEGGGGGGEGGGGGGGARAAGSPRLHVVPFLAEGALFVEVVLLVVFGGLLLFGEPLVLRLQLLRARYLFEERLTVTADGMHVVCPALGRGR